MRKRLLFLTILLIVLACNATPAIATTLIPVNFKDLVTESEVIFIGTVTMVTPEVGVDDKIYTKVTFDNLHILKGIHPDNTLILELAGGTINEYSSKIAGMPEFQVGGKHLVFMRGNGRYLCPIVGWSQGKFNIVMDNTTGAEIVLDSNNNPVVGIINNEIVKSPLPVPVEGGREAGSGVSPEHGVRPQKAAQAMDAGKRLSLPAFISTIEGALGLSRERSAP